MEKCVLSDKINKLGLYNFNINEIKDIIEKYNIKPFYYKINFELTLFFYSSEFIISVEELGISVLNYYSEQNNSQWLFDLFEELINKGDFIFKISIFKKFKSYNNNKNIILEEKNNNIEKLDIEKLIEKEKEKQKKINELSSMQEVINNTNICNDYLSEFVNNLIINFQNIDLINLYKIGCDKLTDKNDLVKWIIPSWSNYIEIINN